MKGIIAAVDIGATKITVSICSIEGILIRVYQRTCLEGDERAIPDQVKRLIEKCFEKINMEASSLSKVGISTAGPFRQSDGMIELVSPNLCGGLASERDLLPNGWISIPLERELKKHYPNLAIENDAISGVVAERTFGAGTGVDDLLYVTWSTGIGTGAFVDGRLIQGKNGNAPHGGHVYVGEEGPVCGCGGICHLEAASSGMAIARDHEGSAGTAEVFEKYKNEDESAAWVIKEAARYFGRGLASINAVLDTKMIVIGGSVFLNNKDLLLPMVKEEFYRSFPALTGDVVFAVSELGDYLGDVAAASLVIPNDWIDIWKVKRPWEDAPDTIHLDDQ